MLKEKEIKYKTEQFFVNRKLEKREVIKVKLFNTEGQLQLQIINETQVALIEKQNEVKARMNELLAKCRHLVGSFKHSSELKRILNQVNYLFYKKIFFSFSTELLISKC
jgi:hypothetical protein